MEGVESTEIRTVEMHTGGDAVRIVHSGYPPIKGSTVLEKRRYVQDHLDHLRRMLMREPRGHSDMFGVIVTEADSPEADLVALFMHNNGYATMCGHVVISLGRYAIDYNLVKPVSPVTRVNIECPCGLVTAYVQYESGRSGHVHFESVPSFAFATDLTISLEGVGEVHYDIAYGGAFYMFVDIKELSMDFQTTSTSRLAQVGFALKKAVMAAVTLTHPVSPDLAFLYGTIITDGREGQEETQQLCVYANGQVDSNYLRIRTCCPSLVPRSTFPTRITYSVWIATVARAPCGSGVCARVALQYHKKQIQLGQEQTFVMPKVGSKFTGKALRVEPVGCYGDAVVVEVGGRGHYIGEATWRAEAEDNLTQGFLLD